MSDNAQAGTNGTAEPPVLIDAHHHLWDLARRPQSWLDEPGLEPIRRSFGLQDLRAAATGTIGGARLGGTVVVQCIASVPETRDLLALADQDPLIKAVVGWADLTAASIGDELDALLAGPGGRHLRSIRHLVQGESDPEWLQRPDVEHGLRAIAERGLRYDLLIRSHQFPQGISAARRHPELPFVLNHAGKPPIARGELAHWERQVRLLAAQPNVVCKISGLGTEADPERWTVGDLRPVWDVLVSSFGFSRLMFGSDWPVSVLAGGWNRWAAAVDRLLAGCSPDEARAVLSVTAAAFYGIHAESTVA